MALYFATPVMYSMTILPEKLQKILIFINPMASYIVLYRDIMYYGRSPKWSILIYAISYSVAVFIIGYMIFQKLQKKFAELL